MISVIPLETKLGICIYKTLLLHRPDDYIDFTPSCSRNISQQYCAHGDWQFSVECFTEA